MTMKTCSKCGLKKPRAQHFKKRGDKKGYRSHCNECRIVYLTEWREKHPGAYLTAHNRNNRISFRKREKEAKEFVFKLLGKECAHCGFADERALHIDHVHDDGSQERKKKSGGKWQMLYKRLMLPRGDSELQVLCANCNAIKEYERRLLLLADKAESMGE